MNRDPEVYYYMANIESSFIALKLDIGHLKRFVNLNSVTMGDYKRFFINDITDDVRLMITYTRALKDKLSEEYENGNLKTK